MKIYHTNLASFRKKCHQLEEEKTKLKESKHQLELEVVRLREELDGVSFRSSISSINVHRCKGQLNSGISVQSIKSISVSILF